MNWYINADGTTNGMNSATDSDEDMGFALVMADAQWGGYTTVAKSFLALVLANDFETDWSIKGGDQYKNAVDPSYLAPAYYKVFATIPVTTAPEPGRHEDLRHPHRRRQCHDRPGPGLGQRPQRAQLHLRRDPHALPRGAGRLLVRRHRRRDVQHEHRGLLRHHRRRQHQGWLQPERHRHRRQPARTAVRSGRRRRHGRKPASCSPTPTRTPPAWRPRAPTTTSTRRGRCSAS